MSDTLVSKHEQIEALSDLTLPLMWTLRQDAVKAFEPFGLSPTKVLFLSCIAQGLQSPKDLAEIMDTVPPAVSAVLADLEAHDLISRTPEPADRRRIKLKLTDKGRDTQDQLRNAWLQSSEERLRTLSEHELATLVTIYRKLVDGH